MKYVLVILLLTACATNPDRIAPAYVSNTEYANKTCARLDQLYAQNLNAMNQLQREMKTKSRTNTTAGVVGAVLFWPALFFMKGKDASADQQMSMLKGNDIALRNAMRKC